MRQRSKVQHCSIIIVNVLSKMIFGLKKKNEKKKYSMHTVYTPWRCKGHQITGTKVRVSVASCQVALLYATVFD